jgi:hypothetical protein
MDHIVPGTLLGDFELQQKLGAGGMGAVYKARQRSLDRIVAVKILPHDFAQDAELIERFLREARITARLNHPHVITGIDVGEAGGYYYFAMELVDGETLRARIERELLLDESEITRIGAAVASALAHAHDAGIVHRDVKPDNILLERDGTPKLADLGCAKGLSQKDSSLTQTGSTLGTPHYMSPEQASGEKDIDGRSDLYSLGCTLYHAATGETPYDAATPALVMVKHISEPVPSPHSKRPDLSSDFCAVIERMVEKKREDRYRNLTEAYEDLDALCRGAPPPHIRASIQTARTASKKVKEAALPRAAVSKRAAVPNTGMPRYVWALALTLPVLIGIVLIFTLGSGPSAHVDAPPVSHKDDTAPAPAIAVAPPPKLPIAPAPPIARIPPAVPAAPTVPHIPAVPIVHATGNVKVASQQKPTRYWVAKAAAKVGVAANWAKSAGGSGGAAIPGPEDIIEFDEQGGGNCGIDGALNVAGIIVSAGYPAAISIGPGTSVTISKDFSQAGGKFSAGNSAMTVSGDFTISAGTFSSTSGKLSLGGEVTISGGAFVHNSGEVILTGNKCVANTGAAILNNVTFALANKNSSYTVVETMTIAGNLVLSGIGSLAGGKLAVAGNVTTTVPVAIGTATILFTGAANQCLNAGGAAGSIPAVCIDKSGGKLTIQDLISISGDMGWTYIAGNVDSGSSTIHVRGNAITFRSGSMAFNHVSIDPANPRSGFAVTGTMIVAGNLEIVDVSHLDSGIIAVAGNVTTTAPKCSGTATLLLNGSGDQKLSANGGKGAVPAVSIDKSGGTLIVRDTICVGGEKGWTYTAGKVDTDTSTVYAAGSGATFNSGSMAFDNLIVEPENAAAGFIVAGTLKIHGKLAVNTGKITNNGTIIVAGKTLSKEDIERLNH